MWNNFHLFLGHHPLRELARIPGQPKVDLGASRESSALLRGGHKGAVDRARRAVGQAAFCARYHLPVVRVRFVRPFGRYR